MTTKLDVKAGIEHSPPKSGTLRVEIVRTTPIWPRSIFIQWVLRNPVKGTTYTFDLSRAGSGEGPWTKLNETSLTDYCYLDEDFTAPTEQTSPEILSLNTVIYYKLDVKVATTVIATTTKPNEAELDRRRRGMRRKLVRDAYLYLKKIGGTECAILKRRYWGEPCTVCRTTTGQSVRSHCNACHGTGLKLGYWSPVYTYAQRRSLPIQNTVDTSGKLEVTKTEAILPVFPLVEPDDIVVFLRDNKRYRIEQVSPTQLNSVDVHQEAVVSELAKSSTEYGILVDPHASPPWF